MPWKKLSAGISLEEVASKIDGEVHGSPAVQVYGICPLNAPRPDCLAFTRETRLEKLKQLIKVTPVAALLVKKSERLSKSDLPGNLILVAEPLQAMVKLMPVFFTTPTPPEGISPKADVHPSAKIGNRVAIGPFVSIGADVEIGDGVVIHPQVTLYPGVSIGAESIIHAGAVIREDCSLGPHCVVHAGAVIGSDGFGYFPGPDGRLLPVPQLGTAIVESDVDVGANTCVDRATLGATVIGPGTKIDNLVQVGHNVRVGANVIMCGQAGIAGSAVIGDGAVLGGGVGVSDHVTVGPGSRLGARGLAIDDIPPGTDYVGTPAQSKRGWLHTNQLLSRLPEVFQELKRHGAADPKQKKD